MKNVHRVSLLCILSLVLTLPTQAATAPTYATNADQIDADPMESTSELLKTLVKYVKNLGSYLGYDLAEKPETTPTLLLDENQLAQIELSQNYLIGTTIGSIPVTSSNDEPQKLISPADASPFSSVVNSYANFIFQSAAYNTLGGSVSVSELIDQKEYQSDPVSQAVLNLLSTPDTTYCMNNDATAWIKKDDKDCNYLYQYRVMKNVIGTPLPGPAEFFSYKYNQSFLPQLNTNSLIAPMLYSKESSKDPAAGAEPPKGLKADSQAQAAANFIRYVSGAVMPISLPSQSEFKDLYTKAYTEKKDASDADIIAQKKAQAVLAKYLTALRVYAAQSSVGFSNLYYILSKRMPQNQGTSPSGPSSSQALSEFNMASWRLLTNPNDDDPSKQWRNQINNASAAKVQKEMAILLAEINYQLYLTRQQQERLLLTNSVLLLQSANSLKPTSLSEISDNTN